MIPHWIRPWNEFPIYIITYYIIFFNIILQLNFGHITYSVVLKNFQLNSRYILLPLILSDPAKVTFEWFSKVTQYWSLTLSENFAGKVKIKNLIYYPAQISSHLNQKVFDGWHRGGELHQSIHHWRVGLLIEQVNLLNNITEQY